MTRRKTKKRKKKRKKPLKERAKAEEDPQRARPKKGVRVLGQDHTIDEGHTPEGNLDPVDPDPKEGVEIEKTVHLTEDEGEADLEIGNTEGTLLETDIDIRRIGEGVEIDTARGATGVGLGTAADHHSNTGLERVEVAAEIAVITLPCHLQRQKERST